MRIAAGVLAFLFLGCGSSVEPTRTVTPGSDVGADARPDVADAATKPTPDVAVEVLEDTGDDTTTADDTGTVEDTGVAADTTPETAPADTGPAPWSIKFPLATAVLRGKPDKIVEDEFTVPGTYKSLDVDLKGSIYPTGAGCTYPMFLSFEAGGTVTATFYVDDASAGHVVLHQDLTPPVTFSGTAIKLTLSAYSEPSVGCSGWTLLTGASKFTFK